MSPPNIPELLEQRRAALESLPGVIGTAIGTAASSDEPAVHLYVTPQTEIEPVRAEAERLLEGAPVEIVAMDVPQAQSD